MRDLTEQEAIEQADSIWLDCLQASKSDSRRLGDLEASSLDQDEALAEIYQLLAGGEAMSKAMIRVYARLVIAGRKTIDDVPEAGREAVRAYIAGLDEGSGE